MERERESGTVWREEEGERRHRMWEEKKESSGRLVSQEETCRRMKPYVGAYISAR